MLNCSVKCYVHFIAWLYIFNKPFYINPFTADSRWDLPKYFFHLPNAASILTVQCAADKQPAPDAHRDLVTLHLFFFYSMHYIFPAFLNPPFLLPHESQHHDTDVGSTRLTSLLYDGPRATEGSYFAAARTGDWRHWLELTVVTRCKLWTTQTCHSLSGDLLNYHQMRNLTKCTAYWLDYRHQVNILCHKTLL